MDVYGGYFGIECVSVCLCVYHFISVNIVRSLNISWIIYLIFNESQHLYSPGGNCLALTSFDIINRIPKNQSIRSSTQLKYKANISYRCWFSSLFIAFWLCAKVVISLYLNCYSSFNYFIIIMLYANERVFSNSS